MSENFEPTQETRRATAEPAQVPPTAPDTVHIPEDFYTQASPQGSGQNDAVHQGDADAVRQSDAVRQDPGELALLRQKLAEQEDAWLRARAEAENVRRRAQEDVARAHKFAIEKFARELLTVKDSLEAALANSGQSAEDLRSGVELTLKQLSSAFEKAALKEINPVGEKFDPNLHEAIQTVPSTLAPDTVAHVLQKGYLIAERLLRPATVMVSRGKETSPS